MPILSKEEMKEAAEFGRSLVIRACKTCAHRESDIISPLCGATGNYITFERSYSHTACGKEGKLWSPKPPRTKGIFEKIWIFLFGG